MVNVLIVDDQRNMRVTLAMMLRQEGYDVREAGGGPEAIAILASDDVDVVISDMRMKPMGGLELIPEVKRVSPGTEVVVMTAFGSIENAVEAMRVGAFDYVTKPFKSAEEITIRIERAMERRRMATEIAFLRREFRARYGLDNLVGNSRALRECLERVMAVAATDATVLIQGESGTGKELIAKAIHANSPRRDKAFVPVNCAGIPDQLMEAELFGHTRGAFTGAINSRKGLFEEANGGTFFFDEVTEISPAIQAKLLRVLQEREIRRIGDNQSVRIDVRIIAASNREMEEVVASGQFRNDLYYRLNVVPIHVPPLRERKEDIPLLARHFLEKYNREMGRSVELPQEIMRTLMEHDYPGNVRELENTIQQMVALHGEVPSFKARVRRVPGPTSLEGAVAEVEKRRIEEAMTDSEGDMQSAARELGLSTTTLWRKIKKHQIRLPQNQRGPAA
jgi:two-component system response regulator HydG